MENINWICKSTTVNNNIVWACHPKVKEHFEATPNTVQLFSAANYGGNSSSFGIGRYTSTQLDKIGPKALQSIKVPSGLVALIYQNADFTGYGKAISADTPDLSKVTDSKNTGFNWSNQMQSLIVQPYVALPTSISDKMPKISLVAPDPNSFITAVSGAVLTRIDDKSYLYVDPNNKDNIFWYNAGDLQIIPPFGMANISGLQLWFDGRDPAANGSQPADGSNITVWNDKSGKGNNTNAITGTPTYSVKNGVVFDGNSYFTLPNGSIPFGDSSYSIYVIAMTGYDTQNRYGSIIGGGVAGSNQNLRIMTTMNPGAAIYTSWWGNDIAKGTTTKNVPFLYNTFYDSGSTQTIYFNGAQVHTGKPSPRNQPNGPNYIGFNAANEKMLGTISEILVFNSSHTDTQRQIIEGYLAWKWGLQSNLPNNHPFKSAAPSGSTAFPRIINYLENVSFVRIAPANPKGGFSYFEISQIVIKDDNGVNLAKSGSITQKGGQPALLQNYPVERLISGKEESTEHPNVWSTIQNSDDAKNFFIEVALPKPTNVTEVTVYTRNSTPWYFNTTNNTVQFLDSNRNLLAARTFPGNGATKQVINKLGPNIGTPGLIKFVRIERSDPNSNAGYIQIAQLQVLDLNNKNVAKYQIAKSPDGRPAEYAVDGAELTGPSDRNGQIVIDSNEGWWELTLAAPTAIKQIIFYNRQCCFERMEPFRISLLDKDRNVIFNTSNFVKEGVQIFNITGKAAQSS